MKMSCKEMRDTYRLFHNRLEFGLNRVINANINDYDEAKKQLAENIQAQIEYLNKIKMEVMK
jgi:hypothetical protein